MRGFCYGLVFAAAGLPMHSLAADSTAASVDAHMRAVAWLTGTYQCVQHTEYSNGTTRNDNQTLVYSSLQGGWIHSNVTGGAGFTYFGYDPNKNKYVVMGVGGPGNYGGAYFSIAADRTISFEFPDLMDNDANTAGNVFTITPTAKGYSGTAEGSSSKNPGVRYKTTFTCVRQ